jgi:hypothetical protein
MNRRRFLELIAGTGAAKVATHFLPPIGGWHSDVIAKPNTYKWKYYDTLNWAAPGDLFLDVRSFDRLSIAAHFMIPAHLIFAQHPILSCENIWVDPALPHH